MLVRSALVLAALFVLTLPASAAPPPLSPRDDVLRVAPTDFALVVVVQNLRDNITTIGDSPFAAWFPTTPLGKQFLGSVEFAKIREAAAPLFGTLGVTPSDVLHDIVGEAIVFAYSPAQAGNPKGERSVILLHPAKPNTLAQVLDRLNAAQSKSKELKALVTRQHAGLSYFERQKSDGSSDFYCFCGGVFAFTGSEEEIRAVIDRAQGPRDKPPELAARVTKLGVADAAVVVLVNPRPLDAELAAKVKSAKPADRAFLSKFAAVWAATDAAALYLKLDTGAELGLSLQFDPEKLPAGAKDWLVGDRTPSAVWAAIPEDALVAVAGRVKATDLLQLLASVTPEDEKKGVRETVEQALGPIVGRDKLPHILDAIGPDWALWVTPPAAGTKDAAVPVLVAAVKVQTDGPTGAEATKALLQALEFGFQTGRYAYNAAHKDQIDLLEEKDGEVVIKSLSGDVFPVGFRPCFALKGGYLLVSSSPAAIKAFRAPTGGPKPGGNVPLARWNAAATRTYLTARGPELAKVLAAAGAGEELALAQQLAALATVLGPVEKVELVARGNATGLQVSLRVSATKPLRKP